MRRTVEVARSGPRPAIRLRRVPPCDPPYDDEREHPFWPIADQLALDWPSAAPPPAGTASATPAGTTSAGATPAGTTRATMTPTGATSANMTPAGATPAAATPAAATPAAATPASMTTAAATPAAATPASMTTAGATPAAAIPASMTTAGATPAAATPAGATPAGATPAGATLAGATLAGMAGADAAPCPTTHGDARPSGDAATLRGNEVGAMAGPRAPGTEIVAGAEPSPRRDAAAAAARPEPAVEAESDVALNRVPSATIQPCAPASGSAGTLAGEAWRSATGTLVAAASARPRTRPVVAGTSTDAKAAVHRFVRLCVEVLNGYRPAAHLRRFSLPAEAAGIVAQGLAAAQRVASLRKAAQAAARRPLRRPSPAAVIRLRLCEPRPGAVEAAVALVTGDRTWALALRLELHQETWAATALRLI
jgi:Family of unknown function (DUF6459)